MSILANFNKNRENKTIWIVYQLWTSRLKEISSSPHIKQASPLRFFEMPPLDISLIFFNDNKKLFYWMHCNNFLLNNISFGDFFLTLTFPVFLIKDWYVKIISVEFTQYFKIHFLLYSAFNNYKCFAFYHLCKLICYSRRFPLVSS